MLRRLFGLFKKRSDDRASIELPSLDRDQIEHLLMRAHDLPQVDWRMARLWAHSQAGIGQQADALFRAIVGAWLDELRDAIESDHRRWRRGPVEGLAPMAHGVSERVAATADASIREITRALKPIRGDSPIPPIAIVALDTQEDYLSFIAPFYPDEGNFATSGGVYLHDEDMFPVIALPAQVRHSIECTIAHELTHHALATLDLPRWAEEGLTQMMEERVTGHPNFRLDHEMISRHRAWWNGRRLAAYLNGRTFSSPHEDEQELSYNLSQLLVRRLLTEQPAAFFEFARHASEDDDGRAAASEHLGIDLEEYAAHALQSPSAE
jgi:hypothetical protein